jgi:predicted methyltransferase
LVLALVASLAFARMPLAAGVGIEAALSAADRPAADRVRDAGRHPAAILGLLDLKPGEAVVDVFASPGYYTELMARVVGPNGRVLAYDPPQFVAGPAAQANWRDRLNRNPNVRQVLQPFDDVRLPEGGADAVLMHLAYHESYWESSRYGLRRMEPRDLVRRLWTALKPGGRLLVVDHVAEPGDPRETVERYHHIPVLTVVRDVTSAGFVLRAHSEVLRNADDDRRLSVFHPSVRGRTDRMVLLFVKPAG